MIDKTNRVFDKETSFRTLELVNSWIVAADNKSSILIAFIALLVGLSANIYSDIVDQLVDGSNAIITLIILTGSIYFIVLGFVIYHLIEVFIARTKFKESGHKVNLFSFVSVSELSSSEYIKEANKISDDDIREMLLSQVNVNSKIARRKMKHFNLALIFSIILIPITIALMIIIG